MKLCKICNINKELTNFGVEKKSKDGLWSEDNLKKGCKIL
jgi:hypothetical protein